MITQRHFKTGDEFPTVPDDGKLRLLSMVFCPWAQRVHLVLNAKHIPFHTININLTAKPEWLTEFSPLAKVPALGLTNENGTPYIYESAAIVDYLEEKYPSQPIHPTDPLRKTLDRLLIQRFEANVIPYYRVVFAGRDDEALSKMFQALDEFEQALAKRGDVKYFGGKQLGIIDVMIWPWFERFPALKHLVAANVADKYEISEERFPKLSKWGRTMVANDVIQKTYLSENIHVKYYKQRQATGTTDYDMLL